MLIFRLSGTKLIGMLRLLLLFFLLNLVTPSVMATTNCGDMNQPDTLISISEKAVSFNVDCTMQMQDSHCGENMCLASTSCSLHFSTLVSVVLNSHFSYVSGTPPVAKSTYFYHRYLPVNTPPPLFS